MTFEGILHRFLSLGHQSKIHTKCGKVQGVRILSQCSAPAQLEQRKVCGINRSKALFQFQSGRSNDTTQTTTGPHDNS